MGNVKGRLTRRLRRGKTRSGLRKGEFIRPVQGFQSLMNSVLCNWKADDLPKLLKIDQEAKMN